MEQLFKKLLELNELVKAVKADSKPTGFTVPKLPAITPPAQPSMKPSASAAKEGKIPGMAPAGKKDPRKIAEQIKNGQLSNKSQKLMLKAHDNGQWYLEKESHTITEINPQLKADKLEDNKR